MQARGIVVGVALLVFGEACGIEEVSVGDCAAGQVADVGHRDADGLPDPCHLRDPVDVINGCPGGRIVHWPVNWEEPLWLWFGPEEQAPVCPEGSTTYEGHADLVAPSACEACTCDPPTGSCALPETITASTATCGAFPSGALSSFDPPAAWDGQCDDADPLPGGAAHAMTIGALTMTENGCATGPTVPAKVISWHWQTFARACDGKGWRSGFIERSVCIPDADPTPSGFHLCAVRAGEHACPVLADDVFTEQHVFFEGVNDQRACSACTCGAPEGSLCTATISIYKGADLTCVGPAVAQLSVSSVAPVCVDIAPPGLALGGKSAGLTSYLPGSCPPEGGEPNGLAARGTEPVTFCCEP